MQSLTVFAVQLRNTCYSDVCFMSTINTLVYTLLCPHRRRVGHIVFGADPVGVDVGVGVGVVVTLSSMHDI